MYFSGNPEEYDLEVQAARKKQLLESLHTLGGDLETGRQLVEELVYEIIPGGTGLEIAVGLADIRAEWQKGNAPSAQNVIAMGLAVAIPLARGTKAREVLRRNLGKYNFPVRAEAHHLFGVELFDTQLGKKLQGWGIDLNGAANGVYLPVSDYPGRIASLHRGRTAAAYTEEVMRRLGAARNRNQALEILDEIRDDLLNGRLKINGAE